MKTVAVLSLILNLRFCLSIPLSTENVPERIRKSAQSDSVPIALLLVVPSTLPQFRDDGEDLDGEDTSFIEDQLINLLLRDAEIPYDEDQIRMGARKEESLLYAADLKALNPLLQKNGEDVDVNIVVEESLLPSKNSVENILPEIREDNMDFKAIGESLPSDEDKVLNVLTIEDIKVRLVPEDSLLTEDSALNIPEGDDISFLREIKPTNDQPIERSYVEYTAVDVSTTPKPAELVVSTFPEAPESAIPILLNCAPKVERGHLAETSLSYRSHEQARKNADVKHADLVDLKNDKVIDFKVFDAKNSDVLDMNSPASIITTGERRKRYTLPETGVTHYKVSEDYPEDFKGNHHLVSADYPEPNMLRVTALKEHN